MKILDFICLAYRSGMPNILIYEYIEIYYSHPQLEYTSIKSIAMQQQWCIHGYTSKALLILLVPFLTFSDQFPRLLKVTNFSSNNITHLVALN